MDIKSNGEITVHATVVLEESEYFDVPQQRSNDHRVSDVSLKRTTYYRASGEVESVYDRYSYSARRILKAGGLGLPVREAYASERDIPESIRQAFDKACEAQVDAIEGALNSAR